MWEEQFCFISVTLTTVILVLDPRGCTTLDVPHRGGTTLPQVPAVISSRRLLSQPSTPHVQNFLIQNEIPVIHQCQVVLAFYQQISTIMQVDVSVTS